MKGERVNIIENIIQSQIREYQSREDSIIREAFQDKFGIPIDSVKFEIQILEDDYSPFVFYRWRNTDFLVVDKQFDLEQVTEEGNMKVSIIKRYKKL